MEEETVFDKIEIKDWDSEKAIAEKLMEHILSEIDDSDDVIAGEEYAHTEAVTKRDVVNLIRLRQDTDTVHFSSASKNADENFAKPMDERDTGKGVNDGYDSTTVYEITCPRCYGVGEIEVSHGWNCHYKCDNCGQHIMKGG